MYRRKEDWVKVNDEINAKAKEGRSLDSILKALNVSRPAWRRAIWKFKLPSALVTTKDAKPKKRLLS